MTMYDVLVLGGGPAGLQAALSISRHFRTVALIYADPATMPFRNAAASHMHNVLGYDHTPPEEYRAAARAQLVDRYSQTLRVFGQNRIVAASKVDRLHESSQLQLPTAFQVQDEYGQTWLGRKLVLATGCQDRLPEYIVGFNEAWGKAIYHCLFCHGFEERGAARNGSLITVHESATIPPVVHTLAMALRFARHHTLFTNGAPPNFLAELAAQPDVAHMLTTGKTRIDNRKIAAFRLMEGEKVTKDDDGHELEITFDDGDHGGDASHATVVKFLSYLATPVLSPTSQMLAAALGVKVSAKQDAMLVRDFLCETSCPGVFAAGDVGGPAKAVVNGLLQGAGAGAGACMQLALEDVRLQRMSAPDVLSSEALGITGAGARLETAPATGEQSRA